MSRVLTNEERRLSECGETTGDVVIRATSINGAALESDPHSQRSLRVWGAGAYDRIAAGFRGEAREFVGRQAISVGERVLDAACGSGNLTIPAALAGALVTGIDIVPSLLDAAQAWAMREGLGVRLDLGSVEDLPYNDGQFDVVLSMFGTMFAARPERVVAELARVTRRGGRVALANWTRAGFIGRMLALHVSFAAPPADLPSPLLWGDQAVIDEWFDNGLWDVRMTPQTLTFDYPHTPAGTAELFRAAYGPTVRTFEAISEDRRAEFAAALADLWSRNQLPGSRGTQVDSDYLEVVAVRR